MSSLVMSDRVTSAPPLLTLSFNEARELVRKAHELACTPVPGFMTSQTFLFHLHNLGAKLDEKEDAVFFPHIISFS